MFRKQGFAQRLSTGIPVALLVFFYSDFVFGQLAEEQVEHKIVAAGGRVHKDANAKIDLLFLGAKLSSFDRINDHDVESIDFSVLSRLRALSIASSTITDRSIAHLRKAPAGLEWLDLAGHQITDKEVPLLLKGPDKTRVLRKLLHTGHSHQWRKQMMLMANLFQAS